MSRERVPVTVITVSGFRRQPPSDPDWARYLRDSLRRVVQPSFVVTVVPARPNQPLDIRLCGNGAHAELRRLQGVTLNWVLCGTAGTRGKVRFGMHPRDWCCGCGYIRADDFKCQRCHEARPEHYGLDAAVIRWSHRHSRKRTFHDAALLDVPLAIEPSLHLAPPPAAARITSDESLVPSTTDAPTSLSTLADLELLARSILERLDALLPQLRGGTAMYGDA